MNESNPKQAAHTVTAQMPSVQQSAVWWRWWWCGASFLWFLCMVPRPLYEPDEGRYAEIPREMLASGDWIVPHLNGFVYIEKPPLQYWMTALAYSVFGVHDWTARLWTTVMGWATVALVALFVARRAGREAALQASLLGGTSLIWMLVAHQLTLDTSLTFFTTAALLAYCESQQRPAPRETLLNYGMWMAIAAAVLTKGFVALVLPAAAFAIYSAWQRDWQRWRTLHLLRGGIVLTMLVVPWMVLIQRRVPEFFDFFVVREHFLRYLTPIAQRHEPWWFFVPLLLVGTLPWSIVVLRAFITGTRDRPTRGEFSHRRLIWISALLIFIFFSVSHSKLVPYILPMVPLLWVLAAEQERDRWTGLSSSVVLSLVFAGLGTLAILWLHVARPDNLALTMPSTLIVTITCLGSGTWAAWIMRARPRHAYLVLGSAWMLAATILEIGPSGINEAYSAESLARTLVKHGADTLPVFSVGMYDQTLTFYLGHPVRLVEYRGELEFGIARDPQRFIPTLDDFVRIWNQMPAALGVMKESTFDALRSQHVPMDIVARSGHYVAVSRAAS